MQPLLSTLLALLAAGPTLARALSVPGLRGAAAESAPQLQLLELEHGDKRAKDPKTPGWFGDFSEQESTYNRDATTEYEKYPWSQRKVIEFGKDPGGYPSLFTGLKKKPAAWYAETPSGAWWDAWQTFYPPAPNTVMNEAKFNEPWRQTPQGWLQDYDYGKNLVKSNPGAPWFDSETLQFDGYGRRQEPQFDSPRRLLEIDGWQERAVNTSLMCGPPGCTGTALLQLYDPNKVEAANCRLGVKVHPTDYEDDHSIEYVEWITVNGRNIGSCNPGTNACDGSLTLFPCFDNYDISQLITSGGAAQVQGKITQYVDECPYEGNLFSAVVTITCMMRLIPDRSPPPGMPMTTVTDDPSTKMMDQQQLENALTNALNSALNPNTTVTPNNPNPVTTLDPNDPSATTAAPEDSSTVQGASTVGPSAMEDSPRNQAYTSTPSPLAGTAFENAPPELANNPLFQGMQNVNANPLPNTQAASTPPLASTGNVPLQCEAPNCTATASLNVNPMMSKTAQNGGSCSLSVAVNQTDFDDGFGLPEQIDYIKVNDVYAAQNVEPGKNPCTLAGQGQNLTAEEKVYTVVANYDVTQLVSTMQTVPVDGKITDQVDECASQGFLLDGLARIDCFPR